MNYLSPVRRDSVGRTAGCARIICAVSFSQQNYQPIFLLLMYTFEALRSTQIYQFTLYALGEVRPLCKNSCQLLKKIATKTLNFAVKKKQSRFFRVVLNAVLNKSMRSSRRTRGGLHSSCFLDGHKNLRHSL